MSPTMHQLNGGAPYQMADRDRVLLATTKLDRPRPAFRCGDSLP
jgi:hypothetical protein